MRQEDCQLGVKVYTDDGPLYLYTVEELPDDMGIVRVKPTKESWSSGGIDTYHLDDLHLYSEEKLKAMAAKMQAKIDAAKDAFETAFKALNEIESLDDPNEVVGRYSLEELGLINLSELEQTVERGGWSRSNLWC